MGFKSRKCFDKCDVMHESPLKNVILDSKFECNFTTLQRRCEDCVLKLKPQYVFHVKKPLFSMDPFGGDDCAKCKSFSGICGMFDFD